MREIRVVCAVVCRGGKVFVARRGPNMRDPGGWEFPGGKVEAGETDVQALLREIREELGWAIAVGPHLGDSVLAWPERRLCLVAYAATAAGEPQLREHDRGDWKMVNELDDLLWAPADPPLLPAVKRWLLSESQVLSSE